MAVTSNRMMQVVSRSANQLHQKWVPQCLWMKRTERGKQKAFFGVMPQANIEM
jgi:hypothetical protein